LDKWALDIAWWCIAQAKPPKPVLPGKNMAVPGTGQFGDHGGVHFFSYLISTILRL
jgi:hypothetical protein